MKDKPKFDIALFVIGIVLMAYCISDFFEKEELPVLEAVEIELAREMQLIKGSRRSSSFRFWSKEYRAMFTIPIGGIIDDTYKQCRELQKGQRLTIFIKARDVKQLPSNESEISIHGLETASGVIVSAEEFRLNRLKYRHRFAVIFFVGGFITFTRSIPAIKKRINYTILITVLIAILVVMRMLNIGLY